MAVSPLQIGAVAPRFHLRRTFEEVVALDDLLARGPVVVAFYVFDFGNIWSHELSRFGTMIGAIRELGVELVAIAVTPTFAQMAFAERLGVDFPLLSDWEGITAEAYGVRYREWKGHKGLAKRSLFLVDRAGRIAYAWCDDDALLLPDFDRLMEEIQEIAGR